MSTLSYTAVQTAIYQQVTANSPIMAMVSGIYDHPPEATAYPYIAIGDMAANDLSNLGLTGAEYTLNLHVWSREAGHKQTADILNALYGLLNNGNLTVSGHNFVSMRVTDSSITMETDGITYQGALKLQVILTD